ncbi:MAG: hypothetical protein ACRC37_04490 [Lentisphaeria bacterium]
MNNIEQNQLIASEIAKGTSLSDIQKILLEKANVNITYMDLRLLVADLENLQWQNDNTIIKEPETLKEEINDGRCHISISDIVNPNYAISGSTTFPSGIQADWWIDHYGRPGLNINGDTEPSPEDLAAFQTELQIALKKRNIF